MREPGRQRLNGEPPCLRLELHTAFNEGTETITLVCPFFDGAPGEALATPASPDKQLRLDAKCGIGTVMP
ncbi:MAG: hypothetical protein ABIU87_14165 [Ornithinibacter sp.]